MSETEQKKLAENEQEEWRELMNTPVEDLSDKEITSKIRLSIKRRFSSPEWVRVFEYTAENGRRADCIAINTLPSRNYKIVGFEFKASRSDWLSEKNEGEKADQFVQICDEWYVVAGRTGIVEEDELPEGWGLLELKPNSEQLWQLQESELTEYQQGEPDRRFWAKVMEKAVGKESNYSAQDLREARKRGYEKALDEGVERKTDRKIERMQEKAERWDELQEAGFDFLYYRGGEEQIEALETAWNLVRAIHRDNYSSLRGSIEFVRDDVERKAGEIVETLDGLGEGIDSIEEEVENVGELPDRSTSQGDPEK